MSTITSATICNCRANANGTRSSRNVPKHADDSMTNANTLDCTPPRARRPYRRRPHETHVLLDQREGTTFTDPETKQHATNQYQAWAASEMIINATPTFGENSAIAARRITASDVQPSRVRRKPADVVIHTDCGGSPVLAGMWIFGSSSSLSVRT